MADRIFGSLWGDEDEDEEQLGTEVQVEEPVATEDKIFGDLWADKPPEEEAPTPSQEAAQQVKEKEEIPLFKGSEEVQQWLEERTNKYGRTSVVDYKKAREGWLKLGQGKDEFDKQFMQYRDPIFERKGVYDVKEEFRLPEKELSPEEQEFWGKMEEAEKQRVEAKPWYDPGQALKRVTSKEEWKQFGKGVKEFFVGEEVPEEMKDLSTEELKALSEEQIKKYKPEEIQMSDDEYLQMYTYVIEQREEAIQLRNKLAGQREEMEKESLAYSREKHSLKELREKVKADEAAGKPTDVSYGYLEIKHLDILVDTYDQFLGTEPVRRGFLKSAAYKLTRKPEELIPFASDVHSVVQFVNRYQVLQKYQDDPNSLTDTEWAEVKTLQGEVLKKYMKAGVSDGAGEMVVEMPKFMIEFALTGGLAKGGEKIAEKGLKKIGGEAIEEAVEKGVKRQVAKELIETGAKEAGEEILEQIGKKTVQETAVGLVKQSIGAGARTTFGFFPAIASKTVEYTIPNYDLVAGEQGDILLQKVDEGDSFEKALKKAYLSTYVEVLSEDVGVIVEDAVPFLKKSILGKYASKNGIETLTDLEKLAKKVGWNGIIGEVFEEEIAELAQAPIEERKYYDPFMTPEGRERLLTETIGISAFGGLGALNADTKNRLSKVGKRKENAVDITEGVELTDELTSRQLAEEERERANRRRTSY